MSDIKKLIDVSIESLTGYDWFETRWAATEPEHFIKCKVSYKNDALDLLNWIDKFTTGRFYMKEEYKTNDKSQGLIFLSFPDIIVVGFEDPNDATIFLLKFR